MRFEEKQRARELRRQGWSYNDILKEVGVSKSTLSLWLRDIPLTDEQIASLQSRQDVGREKFSRNMRVRRDTRWADFHQEAEEEYTALSHWALRRDSGRILARSYGAAEDAVLQDD